MSFPLVTARSAPLVTESFTMRRSTAAADPILAGVTSRRPRSEGSMGALFRGNHLRMALLRSRLANIIVAVLRSTAFRRIVEHLETDHHPDPRE